MNWNIEKAQNKIYLWICFCFFTLYCCVRISLSSTSLYIVPFHPRRSLHHWSSVLRPPLILVIKGSHCCKRCCRVNLSFVVGVVLSQAFWFLLYLMTIPVQRMAQIKSNFIALWMHYYSLKLMQFLVSIYESRYTAEFCTSCSSTFFSYSH